MKTMEEDGTNADDFEEFSFDDDYLSSDNSFDSDCDYESFTTSEGWLPCFRELFYEENKFFFQDSDLETMNRDFDNYR